ncbi:hypothetical protein BT93_L3450 [Corymbia citriodora subsp. variegata]|uniref:Uncharacterized protein n=1 Tax=Corymbia citriodora subsp. variegata TaxID=360336 RepID=A0A8T0CZT1_CORYI|nr:hypothetical protein BT93_L3450 [Corymbia citriodora subsp. variegata]
MSVQVSAIPSSSPSKGRSGVVERRLAEYHESVWGDNFLKYACPSYSTKFKFLGRVEEQVEELKGEVRKMLTGVVDKPSQMLHLIDQIQRLGIHYHFEREIDEQLEQIYKSYSQLDHGDFKGDDLHMLFNNFKDNEGNFKKSLITDVCGLLSLYEACHLRCHGDSILEEALPFAITHLESIDKMKVSTNLAKQVSHALEQPLRKGLPRLEARHYISLYQEEPSHDEVLLTLAKLDFNLLQEQHRKEIGRITRWWKDIDVARKFPFARDRIPEFAVARNILTRVTALISILDDIYDVHGTLEELVPYTEAIEKWDVDAMDGLPEYMQAHYKALLDRYDEVGNELAMKGRSYRLAYAKEGTKKQARGYFDEAKWFHTGYTPTLEEYMPLALLTTGYEALSITALVGMDDVVTRDAFEGCLFEQKKGHIASAVELLMKENGISEQEAEEELQKRVVDAWKDINEEFLRPTAGPTPVLTLILYLSQVIDVLYTNGDHYTHSKTKLKEHITSLFVSPLPI